MSGSWASSSTRMGTAAALGAARALSPGSPRWGWPGRPAPETACPQSHAPQAHASGSDEDPSPILPPPAHRSTHTTVAPQSFGAASHTSRCRIARPCLGTWRGD